MRNPLSCCLLAGLLSASSALAQFEGVLAMNITVVSKDGTERSAGTITLALSKAGMRGEVNMQLDRGVGMNRVVLCKADTPNTNYLLSDANQTYTAVDLNQPPETERPRPAPAPWTVKKLGREKILGYKTQHVLARKTGTGQSMELWVAKDFLDFETYRKLQACTGGSPEGEEGLTPALQAAGAAGMPLKVVVRTEEGGQVRLEATQVEKKSLPASTFEIPAGYTQAGSGRTWKRR